MSEQSRKTESEIVEEFGYFDEWLDKYEYLIELDKSLPAMDEGAKTDDRLIKGCQSRVWLDYRYEDGKLYFTADSDAIITKGIISLLIKVCSGETPEDLSGYDFGFIGKIGLKDNLSPTRANGLVSMIARIKEIAIEAVSGRIGDCRAKAEEEK